MTGAEFLGLAVDISFGIVVLSIALGFARIAIGPSFGDRVVALDMMTLSIMAFCGLFAIFSDDTAFLDVAVVLAPAGHLHAHARLDQSGGAWIVAHPGRGGSLHG